MITYHHIGGRNGTYPLPLKKGILLKDFHLILYDADENCFEQMSKTTHDAWGKVSRYPYCIGNSTSKAPFNLNFHPTTNSLYHFNEQYKQYNFFENPHYGNYVFGEACEFIRSVELNLLSLEDALKSSGVSNIDFLSLDVQGAEYDILQGANKLLKEHCIGIQLEVEFVKLYKNQHTFSDINTLLEESGFELIEIGSLGRCAPMPLPIGFRGIEQPLYAEAIYIKKSHHLNNNITKLLKAALFSLMYNKLGMCCQFLEKATQAGWMSYPIADSAPHYLKFLAKLWDIYQEHEHIKLPSISKIYSNEDFQNYYRQGRDTSHQEKEKKEALKHYLTHLFPEVEQLSSRKNSSVENLLQQYGFNELANTIRENRFRESACFMELTQKFCIQQE